jgi:ribosomal protein L21E
MKTKAEKKISKVMREFKAGTLHSGKKGPVVKSKDQAIAIAISESKRKKK